MEQRIVYVGLDVHKDTIAVALAQAGKRGELREYGKIANTPTALRTLAAKLASHGWRLRFCYEAGPLRSRHSAPAERSRARMRRSRPVVDSAQARRLG